MKRRFLSGFLILAAALGACSRGGAVANHDLELDGEWILTELSTDEAVYSVEGADPPTMSIAGEAVGGDDGCNRFGGTISVVGTEVSINVAGQTPRACEPEIMERASALRQVLEQATRAELTGDSLVLTAWSLTAVTASEAAFVRAGASPTAGPTTE